MLKKICCVLLIAPLLPACKNDSKSSAAKSEDDVDAARSFIRAALDGKFNEARTYMLSDSLNNFWMDRTETKYGQADSDTKVGYAGASINIHEVKPINDSTTVVIYSNSFKNDHDTLKVVKQSGKWMIDLKYLFQHDQEITKPNSADSLPK